VGDAKAAGVAQGAGYLAFENLTLVPMCRALIDTALLSGVELAWYGPCPLGFCAWLSLTALVSPFVAHRLNAYHTQCRTEIEPLLKDPTDAAWLRANTEPMK
jgi:hypothetical protein